MNEHCWLPDLECWDGDAGSWDSYENVLYSIFKHDFIDSHPCFEGKRVAVRHEPIEHGKEDAFYHITCQDYSKDNNRSPDLRRCERIRWVRAFIENYNCDSTQCENCDGIKLWREPSYQNRLRVHILLEEERYIVVLEPREKYCLLITAFYLEHDHSLNKKIKKYEQYKETQSQ